MDAFVSVLKSADDVVWGVPTIILIMATGILLTARLGVIQFRKLGKALKYMVSNEQGGKGEISSFGALCTALAATVGTGNIVGVATAIAAGGPGALFWMIAAACVGMATKYSEGVLAVKYREIDSDGHSLGGPFYYIEKGLGEKYRGIRWKWLAKIFAVFGIGAGLLGIGTITQTSSITDAVKNFFDPNNSDIAFSIGRNDYTWSVVISAVVVALFVALVVIGGIKRIANVTEVVVPFMIIIYIISCISILILNAERIPAAFGLIFEGAFGLRAVAGGALGALLDAVQSGVVRGIFSNEAGLGSAPIAAAAAKTKEPVRQGLVSMTGTFIDTIIICNMTGLAILVTNSWDIGKEGVAVTINAFGRGIPWSYSTGAFLLMLCLAFFAFTTILGWDYYSERCLEYLVNKNMKVVRIYRWLYVTAVLVGPFLTLEFVWRLADIFNGLMAIPNLIALVLLSGVIAHESRDYFKRLNNGEIDEGFKKIK